MGIARSSNLLGKITVLVFILGFVCTLSFGKYSGGTGEPNDPYLIGTPNDLVSISADPNDWDSHFLLTADISLAGKILKPIGNYETKFSGVFDGGNHILNSIVIEKPEDNYVGLFGYTQGSIIKNIILEDVNIVGSDYVGGVVGYNYGVVENINCSGIISGYSELGGIAGESLGGVIRDCNTNVSIDIISWWAGGIGGYFCDTPVINCHAFGDVMGGAESGSLGGLVGGARWSKIINCSASGDISGWERIGGLAGWSDWYLIKSCYATGDVQADYYAGGLVGKFTGSVENSYAIGNVFANVGAGGLIGADWGGYGYVKSCLSTGLVAGTEKVGGFVGETSQNTLFIGGSFFDADKNPGLPAIGDHNEPNIVGLSTAELFDQQTYIAYGWDFSGEILNGTDDYWTMPSSEGYPVLSFQILPEPSLPAFSGGDGTVGNPFLIASTADFNQIGHDIRLINKHYKLISNLDFNGIEFTPIGSYDLPFTGTFDGNKKRLLNIMLPILTEEEYTGVFGSLDCGAKVFDLGIENLTAEGGFNYKIGGLAGDGYGADIQRCYVIGNITGNGSREGMITTWMYYGRIKDCYTMGYISDAYKAGGIALDVFGTPLSNCFSNVIIDQVKDMSTVASGTEIENCFYDETKNDFLKAVGVFPLAGVNPLSFSELSDPNIFINAGWDLVGEQTNGTDDIWRISENGPVFQWQSDIVMPDVIGMDIANARSTLSLAGLNIVIQRKAYSETVEVGGVLGQNPTANSFCVESHPVIILVSKGPCPYSGGGSGTIENPCRIANVDDFVLLSDSGDDYDLDFILTNDLELGAFTYEGGVFNEIGTSLPTFTGTFNGNGHTISDVNINVSDGSSLTQHGIFRYVGCKGQIRNLNVTGVTFNGINYKMAGGAIVGKMTLGKIENCNLFGSNSPGGCDFGGIVGNNSKGLIKNCSVETTLNGNYRLAGLAIENTGIISECYANINLTATSGGGVAGLVYENSGYIKNSYARGSLTGKYYGGGIAAWSVISNRIENCYAACTLSGYFYSTSVGGLVGYEGSYPLNYPGCVWNKTLYPAKGTGQESESVLGATTEEMKLIATYINLGWDFVGETANGTDNIWRL
ncbi:MAG: GLUG motif-containing protein, partial [Planctomycetota bacterium]